jgi:hypothetical protein
VVWCAAAGNSTDAATHTYTGLSFGTPHPRRHILAGFWEAQGGSNFNAPHTCTIGGVSASLVVQSGATGAEVQQVWIAPVPAGASGDIVVQRAGTMISSGIIVWAAYDLVSATAYDTDVGSFAHPATAAVDVPGGSLAIAFIKVGNAGVTVSWSGLAEDVDYSPDTGVRMSGASASKMAAQFPLSISASNSGSLGGRVCAASFV